MSDNCTVESGYQAHALIGITVKRYVLHNEVHQILGVEGWPRLQNYDIIDES